MVTGITILFLLPLLTVSTPVANQFRVLQDSLDSAPQGFVSVGETPGSRPLNLWLALTSKDAPGLESAIVDVSTPSSSNYGKHLTQDEVNAFLGPSPEGLAAVSDWLSANNISGASAAPAGDWLSISVPVSMANTLFSAKYETFRHLETGTEYARTLAYSVPSHVANYIDHVHPTTTFDAPRFAQPVLSVPETRRSSSSSSGTSSNPCLSGNNKAVTPGCLQHLYDIPSTAATSKNNSIVVIGLNNQAAQRADLKTFLTNLRPDMPANTTFTLETIDGGTDVQCLGCNDKSDLEAQLDVQYTIGVATGVPVTFLSVGSSNHDGLGGFLNVVNFLNSTANPPTVMTTSYNNDENRVPKSLAFKLCTGYAALGLMGISVIFSTGDGGIAGLPTSSKSCTTYTPSFPSGCPYITTVGATGFQFESGSNETEVGASLSAGGFSNYWGAPDYQAKTTSAYLELLASNNSERFNSSGRGFPDVSALGKDYRVFYGTGPGDIFGTSASAPVFASVIALLNDQRLAAGKSVLGFLNPWLYEHPDAFNDVVEGDNDACGLTGFSALKGWDAVTGLGTPNFGRLKTAAGL
ncbi:family S53 protease [Mycena galericulata]|nr:family S53 protease [Mycena galericulata]